MKFSVILLAVMLPVLTWAQSPNFTISGKIEKIEKPVRVYFDYMDNGVSHEDSAFVVNGAFKFSGTVKGYAYTRMALDHTGEGKPHAVYAPGADVIYFYFGKEDIQITSADSLSNAGVTGSKVYSDYMAYNKQIGGSIMDLTKAVNADFAKGTPEQQKDTTYFKVVDARYRKNVADRTERQFQFAKNNPASFFALVALSESAGIRVDAAKVEPVFNALSANLRTSEMGKELSERIAASGITAIGAIAPVFTQNDVHGKPVSLSDFKGKLVLVEFWASWCAPCRAGNPNLVKQYQLYKDKGFEIVSVSLDNVKDRWAEAIAKDGLPWTQVSDLKGWKNEVGRLYGVHAVPQCFLVGRDGKIIGNALRDETLNEKLAAIFSN